MARPPKGKALTLRPIRLDDDVWAECKRLGGEYGTINEGLRTVLAVLDDVVTPVHSAEYVPPPAFKPRPFKGPILKPKDRK